MSIKVMTRVWDLSTARGGELLVLLAIADHADDRGWAWPGVDSLARKTRQTPRHVTRCLKQLAATGELNVQVQRGPRGTNRYQVRCFAQANDVPQQPFCPGDTQCQGDKCVPQMSPESSEPSVAAHTIAATVVDQKPGADPSEQEVIVYAKTYQGNVDLGVAAGAITDVWAKNYWSWRTYDLDRWPKHWREEMFRRFEKEWQQPGSAARVGHKKNLAPRLVARQSDEPPVPVKSESLTLSQMRAQTE